jgi:rRNA maturation endonuclease Nob1
MSAIDSETVNEVGDNHWCRSCHYVFVWLPKIDCPFCGSPLETLDLHDPSFTRPNGYVFPQEVRCLPCGHEFLDVQHDHCPVCGSGPTYWQDSR